MASFNPIWLTTAASRLSKSLIALSAVGCIEEPSRALTLLPGDDEFHRGVAKRIEESERLSAKDHALRTDVEGLVDEAIKQMRMAAAETFSHARAEKARITADMSGIKPGNGTLEISGVYDGEDENGEPLNTPFTVTIAVEGGEIVTKKVVLVGRIKKEKKAPWEGSLELHKKTQPPSQVPDA